MSSRFVRSVEAVRDAAAAVAAAESVSACSTLSSATPWASSAAVSGPAIAFSAAARWPRSASGKTTVSRMLCHCPNAAVTLLSSACRFASSWWPFW